MEIFLLTSSRLLRTPPRLAFRVSTLGKEFFAEVAAFLTNFGLLDVVGIVPFDCVDYHDVYAVEHMDHDDQRRNISAPSERSNSSILTCWIFPEPQPGMVIDPDRITKYACEAASCRKLADGRHWKDSHLYSVYLNYSSCGRWANFVFSISCSLRPQMADKPPAGSMDI
jgi:hypothetical protein